MDFFRHQISKHFSNLVMINYISFQIYSKHPRVGGYWKCNKMYGAGPKRISNMVVIYDQHKPLNAVPKFINKHIYLFLLEFEIQTRLQATLQQNEKYHTSRLKIEVLLEHIIAYAYTTFFVWFLSVCNNIVHDTLWMDNIS